MNGWEKVGKGKWHFFNPYNALCWRYWTGAEYKPPLPIVSAELLCARCKKRYDYRVAHGALAS